MNPAARLVMPAIRWDADRGFGAAQAGIEEALALGVGGFIIFGGERAAVQRLTADLRAGSAHDLLIASDLERGAGQQVAGLTPLPPLAALAQLGEGAVREAAAMTAREALDVGINWVFGPVCDLDLEPANPIVQTRSFGADKDLAGDLAAAWIAACQGAGVLACAKHFPGHGLTTLDSHATLPVVDDPRVALELQVFLRALEARVATVMTAHINYPMFDAPGIPATYSPTLIAALLRRELGFNGLVVTDALIMEGARQEGGEAAAAEQVIAAGGDVLLYPHDPALVVKGLARADVGPSLARLDIAIARAADQETLPEETLAQQRERGADIARQCIRVIRGEGRGERKARAMSVEIVDDDAGGPYPLPPRTAFADAVREAGVEVRDDGERVVLVFADVKSWKGRAGLSAESRERVARLLATPATVIVFGHPRRLAEIPGTGTVLCAWSGDVVMQRAAAARLVGGDAA